MTQYIAAYTHSGKFHADDIFSTALIRMLYPDIPVYRVHEVPESLDWETTLVYDIGGGEFDHHQMDAPVRENGKRYAAFGLLWRRFAAELGLSETARDALDESFISCIDEADSGGAQETLSAAIAAFNPPWNSNVSLDDAFEEAVQLAKSVLEHMIAREKAKTAAQDEVRTALDRMQNRIVILERFAPWEDILTESEAAFVVYPSNRKPGNYNIQGVPAERGSMSVKIPMPLKWRSCQPQELPAVSGIEGLTFCHKSGFLAVGSGIDVAVLIAETALKMADVQEE